MTPKPEENAIIYLAEMLEHENHAAYTIKKTVLDVLGLEEIKPNHHEEKT